MRQDPLKRFVKVRQMLLEERDRILARLDEIEQVLGSDGLVRARRPPYPRSGNTITLIQAVQKVLRHGPMKRRQIADAVQRLGYKFRTADPLKGLGVLLYTNKRLFKIQRRGVFALRRRNSDG